MELDHAHSTMAAVVCTAAHSGWPPAVWLFLSPAGLAFHAAPSLGDGGDRNKYTDLDRAERKPQTLGSGRH